MNATVERTEVEVEVGVEKKAPTLPTLVKLSDAMREGAKVADGYSRTHYVYRRGQRVLACDIGRAFLALGGEVPSGEGMAFFHKMVSLIKERTGVDLGASARDAGLPDTWRDTQSIHDWIVDRNTSRAAPEDTVRHLEEAGL